MPAGKRCGAFPTRPQVVVAKQDTHLRILFATEPEQELLVRQHITRALKSGQLRGPDGRLNSWQVLSTTLSTITPDEGDHAQRLVYN